MPPDATTIPLGGTPGAEAKAAGSGRVRPFAGTTGAQWACGSALVAILLLSLLAIVMAADRPSGLAPTSHNNYFPSWMAGPLGGLWPGMPQSGNAIRWMFTGLIVLMYASYLVVLRYSSSVRARWVVGTIVVTQLLFVLAPPMALTDVFNYINYGRMEVVHGLNPYTTIPIVEPHSDPAFVLSNWHELLSPYGPLFTMLTFVVVPLGVAGSFWALKGILVLASLAMLALVWRCAKLLGRDPAKAVALVGLNPIVLVWGLGGDHNDFLMMLCVVGALYLLTLARVRGESLREGAPAAAPESAAAPGRAAAPAPAAAPAAARAPTAEPTVAAVSAPAAGPPASASAAAPAMPHESRLRALEHLIVPFSPVEIGAGAAFVTAAAFKASAAVLIPVALASLLRRRRSLAQVLLGMAVATLVLGAASLFAFGLHSPDLSTQSRVVSSESLPNLLGLALGAGGETEFLHTLINVVLLACVAACCVMAYRRREAVTACGWASLALLVTLSWALPWYVIWVLPLAALGASRRLRVTVLIVGAYLIIVWAPASGLVWKAIGFHPENTPLGRLHQRYVRELLN